MFTDILRYVPSVHQGPVETFDCFLTLSFIRFKTVIHNRHALPFDLFLSLLISAMRFTASSRFPPSSLASFCNSSFSDSSVVYTAYSSSLTSVAYTAEWVPPRPIQTSR